MNASRALLILSILFLIGFLIPVVYLILGSTFLNLGGQPVSFEAFAKLLAAPRTLGLLYNTFTIAIASSVLSVILATTYAWIVVRTDVPAKRFLDLMPPASLTMPFLVKAFAWIYLLAPTGIINILCRQIFGTGLFNIYSIWGIIFAGGTGGVPLAYLTIIPTMRGLDPSLEEASIVSGGKIIRTLRKVTLPVILPAVLSAFILLTIMGMESFDYPFILGAPASINTLATEIYHLINSQIIPSYGTATLVSLIFLAMTLFTFTFYIYFTRKTYKYVVVTGKVSRSSVIRLGKWRYAALLICVLILSLVFILPFATIVLMSFTTFITIFENQIILNFTLQNYVNALNLPQFYEALSNTLIIGAAAGLAVTFLAALLSYAALKSKFRGGRLIEYISSIPLAFPGIVYGLALFWTFLLFPGINLLYGTLVPLLIALVFIRLPHAVRIISANLMQISNEMEEASRAAGATWSRTFVKITLPLLRIGMTNSFLYTFINSLRELSGVVLLVTPSFMMITVLLLNLYAQHALALNLIAAASVILSVIVIISLVVVEVLQRKLGVQQEGVGYAE